MGDPRRSPPESIRRVMISPAVSALADAALLLPAAMLVLLILGALRQGRLFLAFATALGAAAVTTLVLKLFFHACGHAIVTEVRVLSPSGHVAFGTAFYGALAIMLAAGRGRSVRLLAWLATVLLLFAVGVSRVRTGAHSSAEVVIGFAVGGAALGLFGVLHGWAGRPRLPWLPFGAGFSLALLLLWGSHFSLEGEIARYARRMAAVLDVCSPPERIGGGRFSSGLH